MSDLAFEPSAMKCNVCGKYSHTFDEGNRCREIEYLRLVHDYAILKANHEAFKKEVTEVIGFYESTPPKELYQKDFEVLGYDKFESGKRARAFMQKWEER